MGNDAFYNDNDPGAVAWLLELISRGLVAPGCVSSRSILEVEAAQLAGYRRVHLFAGIAGWDLALQYAGWPVDREVWTASCPCQPFSDAGARRGVRDERNLWPAVFGLVAERRPATVFGEQVASRAGREWLARVRADLEGIGYAFGAADLCAAGVGAPHIRQRLFWVADAERGNVRGTGRGEAAGAAGGVQGADGERQRVRPDAGATGVSERLADANYDGQRAEGNGVSRRSKCDTEHCVGLNGLDDTDGARYRRTSGQGLRSKEQSERARETDIDGGRPARGLVNALGPGLQRHAGNGDEGHEPGRLGTRPHRPASETGDAVGMALEPARRRGPWSVFEIVWCRDPRGGDPIPRRIEPGSFPLAHGVPARVGRLRGYGNAIVPQVAAEFVRAFLAVAPKEG